MERQVPRHRARASGRATRARPASSPIASPAAATSTGAAGGGPYASINFVTAHDGFTLHDLVSYNDKHNEANGEDNRDGADHNQSWNCGVEGPTDDPPIVALRERQKRNFLATLLLSQGVPMLVRRRRDRPHAAAATTTPTARTTRLSWHDWDLDGPQRALLRFTRYLIALRQRHPGLRRRQFFFGRKIRGSEVKDLSWFRPDGKEMSDDDWNVFTRCLGLRLAGDAIADVDADGRPIVDDTLLLLINAHWEPIAFVLPAHQRGVRWEPLLDTREPDGQPRPRPFRGGQTYPLEARALALFRLSRTNRARRPGRGAEPADILG